MDTYLISLGDRLVRLPRVTAILDRTMDHDRKVAILRKQMSPNPTTAMKRSQAARDQGNSVDEWLKKCFLHRKLMPCPSDRVAICRRALPWLRSLVYGLDQVCIDQLVYSEEYQFAGTLDVIASHPSIRGLVVYEFKTSAYKIFDVAVHEAEIQAAAYALAERELKPTCNITGLCTVHITPYAFQENLIVSIKEMAELQQEFLYRRFRYNAAAYAGAEMSYE